MGVSIIVMRISASFLFVLAAGALSLGGASNSWARPDSARPAGATSRTARQVADDIREQARVRIAGLLSTNKWNPSELYRVFRETCLGRLPPARATLQELSRLFGESVQKTELNQAQASSLAATLSAAIVSDQLSRRELDARLAELGLTLSSLNIGRDTFTRMRDLFERAVAEQNRADLQAAAGILKGLKSAAGPAAEQVSPLAGALSALSKGTNKPPAERLTELAAALVRVLEPAEVLPFEAAQISRNCERLLSAGDLQRSDFDALLGDTEACLQVCGVSKPERERVLVAMRLLNESLRPDAKP